MWTEHLVEWSAHALSLLSMMLAYAIPVWPKTREGWSDDADR